MCGSDTTSSWVWLARLLNRFDIWDKEVILNPEHFPGKVGVIFFQKRELSDLTFMERFVALLCAASCVPVCILRRGMTQSQIRGPICKVYPIGEGARFQKFQGSSHLRMGSDRILTCCRKSAPLLGNPFATSRGKLHCICSCGRMVWFGMAFAWV